MTPGLVLVTVIGVAAYRLNSALPKHYSIGAVAMAIVIGAIVGNAVCGSSAIAAVAPVVQLALVVGLVTWLC